MREVFYFFGTLVVCGLIAAVGLGFYFHPIIAVVVTVLLSPFVAYWTYRTLFNYPDANEMGIGVVLGKERPEPYMPGERATIPLLPSTFMTRFWRYPMDTFDCDYGVIKVMSKEGKYPATAAGKEYKSVEIIVDSRAYLNFARERELLVREDDPDVRVGFLKDPRLSAVDRAALKAGGAAMLDGVSVVLEPTHPLIKSLRANVPTTKEGIVDKTEEAMQNGVRAVGASMTWKQANEEPDVFQKEVEKHYLGMDGTLINLGFRPSGIKVAIKLIDPPQVVKDSLAAEEAAPSVAEKESEETAGRVLRMVARTSGMTVDELSEDLKANPKKRGNPATQGGYKEAFAYAEDQVKRDRAGPDLEDIRLGNVDGTPLEPIMGAAGALFGLSKREGSKRSSKDKSPGNPGGGGSGGQAKTEEQLADEFFNDFGKYPKWDPLKRTPN